MTSPETTAALTCSVLHEVRELEALAPAWTELLLRSTTNELTLTPQWLLTWWRVFGPHDGRSLRVVAFHEGSRLVGLAPLCARPHRYFGALPFRRLEFLATGESEEEEVCSDYLSIVAERGREAAVAEAAAEALASGVLGHWDELVLSAMDGDNALPPLVEAAMRTRGYGTRLSVVNGSPYIELPATWDEYLARLPSGRRQNLKRNLREFERWADGEARFHEVTSPDQIEHAKAILQSLHEERWRSAGDTGSFAAPRFRAFHDQMMPILLEAKALDLAWLEVRGEPVAAKYNLVWNGKVYSYQEGRKMDVPSRVRLGIVIRVNAIQRAIQRGLREYDFLAGVRPYKVELAYATRPVVEVRVVPPSLREWARKGISRGVERAREIKRSLQAKPAAEAPAPAKE